MGDLGSIVAARNLGISPKNRISKTTRIENHLSQIIDMYGLDIANTINIALEKYLIDKKFLTAESLEQLRNITEFERSYALNFPINSK